MNSTVLRILALTTRKETRNQRYLQKLNQSKRYPVYLATVNFQCDSNLGFVVRAAACFGAAGVVVIGSVPENKELKRLSGSTSDFMELTQFKNTNDFLAWARTSGIRVVSAELTNYSKSISRHRFSKRPTVIVVGNESTGVPEDILLNSDSVIHIDMDGAGYCLNTAQAANIMMYEYTRQQKYKQ